MKSFDPKGNFIRKYVPELKNFPEELIYEPWKASLRVQSRARCMMGVDYPNRVVTRKEIQKIFKNAQKLLLKNHKIEMPLKILKLEETFEPFKNDSRDEKQKKPKKTNSKIINNSTKIDTFADGRSEEVFSQERFRFREANENHEIDEEKHKKDPREEVILLTSNSQEERQKNINLPRHLIENRVAAKKELTKHSQMEVIHYKYIGRRPQMAMHSLNSKDGKISFIDKCKGIENEKIILRKDLAIKTRGLSYTQPGVKSSLDSIIRLNNKLVRMADLDEPKENIENHKKINNSSMKSFASSLGLNNEDGDIFCPESENNSSNLMLNKYGRSHLSDELAFNSKKKSCIKSIEINPLEISTMKSRTQDQNVVICHIKVHPDEINKSLDINITNEKYDKKILVISKKSLSKESVKKKRRRKIMKLKTAKSDHCQGQSVVFPEHVGPGGRVFDTDKFFKNVIKDNEKIVQENVFQGLNGSEKKSNLTKRSFNRFVKPKDQLRVRINPYYRT